MNMNKIKQNEKNSFELVFKDLTKKIGLFTGKYDASNGSEEFMYGVSAVMNYIAYKAGHEDFEDTFVANMIKSQEKAGEI